jgi:hypothetical protein
MQGTSNTAAAMDADKQEAGVRLRASGQQPVASSQ